MRSGTGAADGGPEVNARTSTFDGRSATAAASGTGRDWIAARSASAGRVKEPSHPQHESAATAASAGGMQHDAESTAAGALSTATIRVATAIRGTR